MPATNSQPAAFAHAPGQRVQVHLVANADFEGGEPRRIEAALQPVRGKGAERDGDEGRDAADDEEKSLHYFAVIGRAMICRVREARERMIFARAWL
jgi:hypothetical protein